MADAVVVGSGINSLACAALLARGGWSVRVLEREDELGGCIRTAELTEPGYLHDVFSAWHPLWVGGAAHAELADELAQRGLEYLNTDHPTATLTPEGEATFLLRSTEANVAELGEEWRGAVESFLPNADLAFGVLGTELWSRDGLQARNARVPAARAQAVRSSSPATCSPRAVTGSRRHSRPSARTTCLRRGSCTRASARTTRAPGS